MNSTPCLPGLFTAPITRRPHKPVRPTSVTAYAKGRESFTGRKANVLRWLAAYWNRYQTSPTSAELAEWAEHDIDDMRLLNDAVLLLYVRRGLSDLQRATKTIQSVVERVPGGDRICQVTGEKCCTWRVIERGTRRN